MQRHDTRFDREYPSQEEVNLKQQSAKRSINRRTLRNHGIVILAISATWMSCTSTSDFLRSETIPLAILVNMTLLFAFWRMNVSMAHRDRETQPTAMMGQREWSLLKATAKHSQSGQDMLDGITDQGRELMTRKEHDELRAFLSENPKLKERVLDSVVE